MGERVKLWRQFFTRPDGSTGIRYCTAEPPSPTAVPGRFEPTEGRYIRGVMADGEEYYFLTNPADEGL